MENLVEDSTHKGKPCKKITFYNYKYPKTKELLPRVVEVWVSDVYDIFHMEIRARRKEEYF